MKLSKRAEKLRDRLADQYLAEDYDFNVEQGLKFGYEAGYSAARLEANVLETLLESYAEEWCVRNCGAHLSDSDKGGMCISSRCREAKDALKKYREEE